MNGENHLPISGNVSPSIKSSERYDAEHEEIETFEGNNVTFLCLKCSNYVVLSSLQDHRLLHEALTLFQFEFHTKPTSERELNRKRALLMKELNKVENITRSSYSKQLARIDFAYEVIKSAIYGRSNKVKPCFIEFRDVKINWTSVVLHEGATLGPSLGVCKSTNEKWRSVMEDAYSYMFDVIQGRTVAYFAVFDGYSGMTAARHCAAQFYQIIKESFVELNCNAEANKTCFKQAFENMDKVLLHGVNEASRNRWSGCSATTCVLIEDTLHVANVGNVKATLINNDGSIQTLTEEHTPANKKERDRIKASGDVCKWSKTLWVNGVVMTTRGLGNHGDPLLKSSIINVPAVCHVQLADAQIILVASHGFWQVFSENEAVQLIMDWLRGGISTCAGGDIINNSIEIVKFNEDAVSSVSMKDKDKNLHYTKTNLNGKQCLQCLNNEACNCFSNDQNKNMQDCPSYEGTKATKVRKEQSAEKTFISKLLGELGMSTDHVAAEVSKHLTTAALTAGAKENITVMIVIPVSHTR